MSEELDNKRDEAFLEVPFKLPNGATLRPFSRASLVLCRAFRLTLFTDPAAYRGNEVEGIPPMSQEVFEDQLMTFAWMQSAPVEDVLAAKKAGNVEDVVLKWSFDIDVGTLTPLVEEVMRVSGMVHAASFTVKKKPGTEETDAPKS